MRPESWIVRARDRGRRGVLMAMVLWLATVPAFAGNFFAGATNVFWPGGTIPYAFDTNNYTITATEQSVILAGLREWQLAANVQFVPYTNQANHVILQFTNDGSGTGYCLLGNPATIMLHGLARGLMCHEAGHLLGFQHEHQRVDRDNFITVNFENIFGGTNGEGVTAFVIDSNSIAFGSYDFASVMHYSAEDFSIGFGFDTLDPLPPYTNFYNYMGNPALSVGDRAAAAHLYGPPATPLTNIVTTTADGGFGSLRAAIYYANDHPGTTIQFNIPAGDPGHSNGVYTISLLGELPPLVATGTIIDGTTQPGYGGHPLIVLDGSQVSPEAELASGLHFYGTNSTVRALALDNFIYSGIQSFGPNSASNHIEGCYLGLKPDGTTAAPNFNGVYALLGGHDTVIGGLLATQRNVISGNSEYGIQINDPTSDRTIIQGNFIGLDASGTFSVSNEFSGVGVWDGPVGTIVGGTNASARNVISGNAIDGVSLSYSNISGAVIQGNFIGTDASGSNAVPNLQAGVDIFFGAHGMTVGGTNAAARNVLSGNGLAGALIAGAGTTNNVVEGNYAGTDVTGAKALPNGQEGVGVQDGATGNLVGGTNAGTGNVLSGNLSDGALISDIGTSNNVVQGNLAGTDPNGTNAVPNGDIGIVVAHGANNNLIGGVAAGAGNLASGNVNYGIVIGSAGCYGNAVQGNLIGTDITGTKALPNGFTGAAIFGASTNNLVGGTTPAAANVISGNATYGFFISDTNTTGNLVEGNLVGTDATGRHALANGFVGVAIFNQASRNFIGSASIGAANVVSGNITYGVFISDTNTSANTVFGNLIGTDITGANPLGNGFANVELQSGAVANVIGGPNPGQGNVIAYSGNYGVLLFDAPTTNNSIRGNSIFGNAGLGIGFGTGGVITNHPGGAVPGPNNLQNFPVLTGVFGNGSNTLISGTLNSTTNRPYWIDVYRNPAADPSGYGQGQTYVGAASATTDSSGNTIFSLSASGNFSGQVFSATASDSVTGDTSQFSADLLASNGLAPALFRAPISLTTTGFVASLLLTAGESYHVQSTTNLANSNAWINLTNFIPLTTNFLFLDRSATNSRARFYRVVAP
ncbi:MAG TPA: M12 family metallopeptidase [Verrucomicrobiae bacterium]|nr:M12 family metallopeptidase [Verrucomicrobiae bacterium]